MKEGRLIKTSLPDNRPSGAQGYFINTRRDKFKDPRVRAALDLVFDFEWSNKKLFYGLYTRTTSYFENSDMKATGKPSTEELTLLDPYKDKLSPEVFGEPYTPPVTDGSGNNRDNLKKARDLLIAAGWKPGPDSYLHNDKGERLTIEFLDFEAMFERITVPFTENLKQNRRRGVLASRRSLAIRAPRQSLSTSTSRLSAYSLRPDARHRDAQLLGLGSGEDGRLVQSSRHLRARGRRADRQGRRSQITSPSLSRRREPSTACSAPDIIGFPTIIKRPMA